MGNNSSSLPVKEYGASMPLTSFELRNTINNIMKQTNNRLEASEKFTFNRDAISSALSSQTGGEQISVQPRRVRYDQANIASTLENKLVGGGESVKLKLDSYTSNEDEYNNDELFGGAQATSSTIDNLFGPNFNKMELYSATPNLHSGNVFGNESTDASSLHMTGGNAQFSATSPLNMTGGNTQFSATSSNSNAMNGGNINNSDNEFKALKNMILKSANKMNHSGGCGCSGDKVTKVESSSQPVNFNQIMNGGKGKKQKYIDSDDDSSSDSSDSSDSDYDSQSGGSESVKINAKYLYSSDSTFGTDSISEIYKSYKHRTI